MKLIKTKSFNLAVNVKGNESAERLAICIPGRLDTKDYANFQSHIEYLAKKDFFAISFDPPGIWESPGGIGLYTTTNYIKAINELIEYFGNRPTLLLGHSRGGAVAILSGCPNLAVRGVILIMASFGDPTPPNKKETKQGFKVSYRDLPPGDKKTIKQKKFELPINYFKDGEQYDVMATLKNCITPKLLFSGTDDEFYSTEEMQEIFNSIPEPKILHELKSEHDYRLHPEVINEVNKGVGKFVNTFMSDASQLKKAVDRLGAYHEAGHAVISTVLGIAVDVTSINDRHTTYLADGSRRDTILVSLAGAFAAQKFDKNGWCALDDISKATKLLSEGEDIEDYHRETKKLVIKHKKSISAVAKELLIKRTLAGHEVKKIVDEHKF